MCEHNSLNSFLNGFLLAFCDIQQGIIFSFMHGQRESEVTFQAGYNAAGRKPGETA